MSWSSVPLGEVAPAKPISLSLPASDAVWQVTLDHIESNTGRLIKREFKPISAAGSSTHAFDERHVLYSKLRPYLNKVLIPEEKGIGTTELVPLMPDPKRLDRGYLAHYLMTDRFVTWITEHSAGAKMPRACMSDFWCHEIPLPPLPEQKRIAATLNKADIIRRKRQQAIELADQFLQSVFLDMFGDPVENSNGWESRDLSDALVFLTSGSQGWAKYYAAKGDKFIRIQNVGKNDLLLDDMACVQAPKGAEADRTRLKLGDVMLSITADLGRSAVATEEIAGAYINQHLALLRIDQDQLKPRYLSAFLASSGGTRQFEMKNKSAVKAGLNFDDIRSLRIPIPPLPLQEKYESIYNKVINSKRSLVAARNAGEEMTLSLSQRAFSGDL